MIPTSAEENSVLHTSLSNLTSEQDTVSMCNSFDGTTTGVFAENGLQLLADAACAENTLEILPKLQLSKNQPMQSFNSSIISNFCFESLEQNIFSNLPENGHARQVNSGTTFQLNCENRRAV